MNDAKQPHKATLKITPFSSIMGCGIWNGQYHIALVPNQHGQEETERLAKIVLAALNSDPKAQEILR